MHLDSLVTNTVIAPDGTRFELTDDLQKWGYVLKRNGGVDKKNNQAVAIFKGPNGDVYSVDNNGTMLHWVNSKGWEYTIKDNKNATDAKLVEFGQPRIFAIGAAPKKVITNPLITSLPAPVKTLLNVNAPGTGPLSPSSEKLKAAAGPAVAPAPISPVVSQPAQASPAYIAEKFAPVAPPESTMKAPLTANGPTYIQEGTKVDPAASAPASAPTATAPLQAKGLTFSNPFIIGGMIVAVILMVIVAKKFGKKGG